MAATPTSLETVAAEELLKELRQVNSSLSSIASSLLSIESTLVTQTLRPSRQQ